MTFAIDTAQQSDWFTALMGLLGVALGGGLTYLITYQFERRRIRDERLARAFSLIFAVIKISEELTKMELEFKSALERADAAGLSGELWTKLTTNVGYSEPITIPVGDLAIVALTRDQDLTKRILETEAAHRIYALSLQRLETLREKFEGFGLHAEVSGEVVTFKAEGNQALRAGPTIIQLRSLSNSLASSLPDAAKEARRVAEQLGPHLKKYFKFRHFISSEYPEAQPSDVNGKVS